ncbi:MAG: Xaa-Pro dipeptidase [Gammaproteobacteria bacterium]|nr:Xaa-Pro dipeptidase [Gammaproteobacteria bacterium]
MNELAPLYADHVARCCETAGEALASAGLEQLVIYAGSEHLAFLDDQTYPFRANPLFKAWLPLTQHPGCWLLYTPGQRPVLLYHQPRDFWHLPPADPDGYWVEAFDLKVIRDPAEITTHLPEEVRSRCAVLGEGVAHWLPEANINPERVLNVLHWHRARKTSYELACMRAANRRAAPAHEAARDAFLAGASEYDIHMAYLQACDHTDDELPYHNIIAVNEHAAVLHYQHRDREPAPRRSLLVDAGADVAGYASDITRTWTVDEGDFAGLLAGMESLQRGLCAEVRAGVAFGDLHRLAHQQIGQLLKDAGVIRLDGVSAAERGLTNYFYPHGLGHLLGVQVHDVGGQQADPQGTAAPPPDDYPKLRLTRRLEADTVVTVEPGIYFIDLLLDELQASELATEVHWPTVERLKPWGGIRIEDNVRAEPDGHENLTRAWLP